MNAKKNLWSMLPIAAVVMLMSCSSGDEDVKNSVTPKAEVTKIPYSITVGSSSGSGMTRAIVDESDPTDEVNYLRSLYFETNDRIYIYGSDENGTLSGYLEMPTPPGEKQNTAYFEGVLDYTGTGNPSPSLMMTATLRSSDQTDDIWKLADDGSVSIDFGTTICEAAYKTDVEGKVIYTNNQTATVKTSALQQAVRKYSLLQGTKTFGSSEDLYLYQKTAFLHFSIIMNDGTAIGARDDLKVTNVGDVDRVGSVLITKVGENASAADFIVPVKSGQTLSNVEVTLYDNVALTFNSGNNALEGKVYNASKTIEPICTAVDLGLPSGTKWANMNVGATKIEGYGLYFPWGETKGYTSNCDDARSLDITTYKWATKKGSAWKYTKYVVNSTHGTVDNKKTLTTADDAARANWGGSWRLPTAEQCEELLENTTVSYTTYNGVVGCWLTSKKNGKKIFLPASGCRRMREIQKVIDGSDFFSYLSLHLASTTSETRDKETEYCRCLDTFFGSADRHLAVHNYGRLSGRSIRPVTK